MYMSVCLLFVCGYLWSQGEVAGPLKLGLQAVVSHLLWAGHWDLNLGSLQVQQLLLADEPSL